MATFWMNEAGGKEALERMSSLEFFVKYVEGVFTSSDSITRIRRKVQEDNESLRGNNYYKRQKLEKEYRDEIKTI